MDAIRLSARGRRAAAALVGVLVLAGTIATAAAFSGPTPAATPTIPPAATAAPTPNRSPAPATTAPDIGGGDAMPLRVELDNATGAAVRVDIVDNSGTLVDAVSGTPGNGMSVAPYTLEVTNVDASTLRLRWVDFPIDNSLALYVDESGLRFLMVQPEPTGPTDSVGFDRELILAFAVPVSAADVQAFLQDGLDTPGN